MGQRSQIYIRYNNSETLVAKHLQWNWGNYMINRTSQLLEYISKNLKSEYSNFLSRNFDISNKGNREDLKILNSLISLNTKVGSYVENVDLIKENFLYNFHEGDECSFKFDPEREDNNNGILVIDILENKDNNIFLKYGLAKGQEDTSDFTGFNICNAVDYILAFKPNINYLSDYYSKDECKEIIQEFEEALKEATKIDEKYSLLSQEEFKEIFEKEYCYDKCLSKKDLEELKIQKKEIEKCCNIELKKELYKVGLLIEEDKTRVITNSTYIPDEEVEDLEARGEIVMKNGADGKQYYSYKDIALVEKNGYANEIITNRNMINNILNIQEEVR